MTKINDLDKRITVLETQLEERWRKYPEQDWEHECPKTPNTLIGVKTRFKSHPNKVDCISDKQTSKVD